MDEQKRYRRKTSWGIYWLILVLAAALACIGVDNCRGAISDAIDATCRVTGGGGSRGTGCAFERSQGHVFILTCYHVVGRAQTVQCEFWARGHQSRPITGVVVARSQAADAAVVAMRESDFGGRPPKVIPVAPRTMRLRPGETITSVGCAKGQWSTGWKGHVIGYSGQGLHFRPPPANGRSGSAIFDAKAEKIVGLLRARTGDDSLGIATSVQALYAVLGREREARDQRRGTRDGTIENWKLKIENLQFPPSPFPPPPLTQCPGGSCNPRWYLSPYRYRQQFRNNPQPGPQQQPAYPTLPYSPPAPSLDLGPTNQKLDKIADLLLEMREEGRGTRDEGRAVPPPEPQPKVVPVSPPPLSEEAKRQAAELEAKVEDSEEQVSRMRAAVNKLIGDRETLRDRFEERLQRVKAELGEDASRRDVARAYAKDLIKEKLGSGAAGLTGGKILGGALGLSGPLALAIGGGLWLVSRRIGSKIEAGEPLMIQRLIDRVTDKVDELKDRVRDVESAAPAKKGK